MSYEELWKTLSDLFIELRKKGEKIPTTIMDDLRSAKTMIQILKADPNNTETLLRVERYLGNVESSLLFLAQNKIGPKGVEQWMKKLEMARREVYAEEISTSKFVPRLPRDKRWIRIQVSEDTSREEIERLTVESGLSCRMQENGYILVYGDSEKIKLVIKKIKIQQKKRKRT